MSLDYDRATEVWAKELTDAAEVALDAALRDIVTSFAPRIQAWMQQNAPWTDRTANARQSLKADVEVVVREAYSIILTHGVEYGVWLELANQGRYAIIAPAVDYWAPLIFAEVQRVIDN